MIAGLSLHIPTTAADTTDEWYIVQPFPGTWRILSPVYFAPATALAVDETNYMSVAVSTNDGAAGSDVAIGSFANNAAGGGALVLKTTRAIAVSGAGLDLAQGKQIKFAKTDPGTGAILDGTFTVALQKVN